MSENPFAILTREPVPDSHMDLNAVVTAGRARVRRRRGVTVVAAAVVVAVVAGAAALALQPPGPDPDPVQPLPSPSVSPPAARCAPEPLPQLGSPVFVDVDASGRYIVSTPNEVNGQLLVSGPDGTRTITTVSRLLAIGVNGSGTIIGNVENDVDTDGYVIDGGTTIRLGKPQGALNVYASAINDTGDVVGDARMPGGRFRAVVWRHGKWSQPQLLSTPSGGQAAGRSAASGIDAGGRIVGSVGNGAQPYLWQADGTGRVLPTPQGKPGGIAVRVSGEWADGPVDFLARTSVRSNGRRIPKAELPWARWNLGTGEVVEVQAGQRVDGATGLLPDGTVVLNVADGAVLWTSTGITKVPAPDGRRQLQITGVSGGGMLVGTAGDLGGSAGAFRWACG